MSDTELQRSPPCTTSPRGLPQALRSLWQSAPDCGAPVDIARALQINFLAAANRNGEGELRQAVARLLRRIPCRAFLLLCDPALSSPAATVSATSRCRGPRRDILQEEIALYYPPAWAEHLPGLLRPLLVSDLPNHLYWAAGWPPADGSFAALARLCEHAILDSRSFADPAAGIAAGNACRQTGQRLSDLNWLRLRPFCRALAEAYQRVVFRPRQPLQATIEHAAGATAAATLLGSWLAQRLAAEATLLVTDKAEDAGPTLLRLTSDDYCIAIQAEAQNLRIDITTGDACLLPFRVPRSRGSTGDLLAAAIDQASG